jgi:tetratricopeptide (TPR) repeat protein
MPFVCENKNCFAPENKKNKAYPVAMDCPFCDIPLTQKSDFSEQEQRLLDTLPYLIAYPLKRTLLENHQWTKLNFFKDTFLNYLKYLGLIVASEFFNSDLKNKNMVALFQNTLAEPSFGTWNLFIRETLSYLGKQNHEFFCKELPGYYQQIETGKKRKLYKGEIQIINTNGEIELKKQQATAIGMLINFRNKHLGHGLTMDDDSSKLLWQEYSPIFFSLLDKMQFSSQYQMFKNEHGETIKLHSTNLNQIEHRNPLPSKVWIENDVCDKLDIIPFFVVPGELAIPKENKEQVLAYESYTGKTLKFFSPEGTEKRTSGKILERLNLLLKEKQIEKTHSPKEFTKQVFNAEVDEYNNYILQSLISERKVIPGIYVNRNIIESKLRDWTGASASVFFIAAEAGSGKTNLIVEKQKQYQESGFKSLIIRAGRMNKTSLEVELKHILNIQTKSDISEYKEIAGTQAKPTFILIDGLNEAQKPTDIWSEILKISKKFDSGSLKFVVTTRTNTQVDLDRYELSDKDKSLIYRETSDAEDIKSSAFWLTPLDMEETKKAWDVYTKKDKSRFKPLFTFNDIADIDRSIYDQISNPLILRIFLETYNSKKLLKKGKKHINIWEEWFATFNQEEKEFMMLLVDQVWAKGVNELLLDDLLNNPKIKDYLVSDTLNSPYPKLKNLGWISRVIKGLDIKISFTVEALLIYLIGKHLEKDKFKVDLKFVNSILNENLILKISGIEEYLSSKAILGDIEILEDLIDESGKGIDISTRPLLNYIKTYDIVSLEEKLMKNPTEGDWKALQLLFELLNKLALEKLRKSLAITFIKHSNFKTQTEIKFGLDSILLLDNDVAKNTINKISETDILKIQDSSLINLLADCFSHIAYEDKALEFYNEAIQIRLKNLGEEHPQVAHSYALIGSSWYYKGDYDKALEFHEKALKIRLKNLGEEHPTIASSYNWIGIDWDSKGNYNKSLEFFAKALHIRLKNLGEEHPKISTLYNNIGFTWNRIGDFNKSLEFQEKALHIRLKVFGEEHTRVSTSYSNVGKAWENKGYFDKSLEFYEKALKIRLKNLGKEHPRVAILYNKIGSAWENKEDYDKALEFYEKALKIRLITLSEQHPLVAISYNSIGNTWGAKGEYDKSLEFHEKALKIRLKNLGEEHPDTLDSYNNIEFLRKKMSNNK